MIFKLEISRNNSTYYDIDLFSNQQLEYDVDFYDSLEVDKIRLPFSTELRLPLTDKNKQSVRFGYDPLVNNAVDFPKEDFFFKITVFGSSNVIIEGILNVKAFGYLSDEPYIDIDLKDFVSKYISSLKDASIADVYDADQGAYGSYFRTNQLFSTFFDTVAAGGEAGVLNQNPTDRPIIFPYIDFCNDVKGKFGYGERQFTEYGTGMDRAGIVPAYSLKNFLTTLGYYLTFNGFNTRVDSKLFGLNYSAAITDMQPEKLQILIPSKLEADKDINTRDFFMRQAPFWTGTNENLFGKTGSDGGQKILVCDWFYSMETFGNFGPHTFPPEDPNQTIPVTTQTQFGLDVTNAAYPESESFGNERGYFAPFMSYNADILYRSGNASANIQEIRYEIPVLGEDKIVYQLKPQSAESTMTFGIFVGVYENGELVKKLRLQDAAGLSGNPIVLNASDATAVAGFSNKTIHTSSSEHNYFYDSSRDEYVIFPVGWTDIQDMLSWNLQDLGLNELYLPDETIEVSGETRYGVNYFIEPIAGEIRSEVGFNIQPSGNHYIVVGPTIAAVEFGVSDIRKAITRTEQYGELNIKFLANANFNPYFTDDEYNIKESLENTATVSPYDVLLAICKRFGCGIFYEYDNTLNINVLRVDPLHLVRDGSQDINELIDDLKSVKVYLGGDKVKNLTINNKDYNLYYDDENNDNITIGSTTQEINSDGISDLTIDLKSSIYYNSLGGDVLFIDDNSNIVNGIVSEREVAFTPNLFTKHQDIGVRFAYVDKPLYNTIIKRPKVVNEEYRPSIYTITQRIYEDWAIHPFNGRLFHYNTVGWNLMAENEEGNTTDYYALFSANEKIRYSNSPTIEFNMILQTSELSSLDFFFKTLSATRINQSSIVVKSAKGEVFGENAYLTITGLLQ
jgi:hypothetical protein